MLQLSKNKAKEVVIVKVRRISGENKQKTYTIHYFVYILFFLKSYLVSQTGHGLPGTKKNNRIYCTCSNYQYAGNRVRPILVLDVEQFEHS